jgi:hypothetical protein
MRTPETLESMRDLAKTGGTRVAPDEVRNILSDRPSSPINVTLAWRDFYSETSDMFNRIWKEGLHQELASYAREFSKVWDPISEDILSGLSQYAKQHWKFLHVDVSLVHCLFGGSNNASRIIIVPFPDFDVEIKLLSHELTHMIVSEEQVRQSLESLGMRRGGRFDAAHAIVDHIAYLSSRRHFKNPMRKGLRPNADFYGDAPDLSAAFEEYATSSEQYGSLNEFVRHVAEVFLARS